MGSAGSGAPAKRGSQNHPPVPNPKPPAIFYALQLTNVALRKVQLKLIERPSNSRLVACGNLPQVAGGRALNKQAPAPC
jgi:hypothetical protein